MSIIKFEITEDHLKLLPHLKFNSKGEHITTQNSDGLSAFGDDDIFESIGLIIYGKPKVGDDFDIMNNLGLTYTEEEQEYMANLLNDIPQVLDIVLKSPNFKPETGLYKRKFHDTIWKKIG